MVTRRVPAEIANSIPETRAHYARTEAESGVVLTSRAVGDLLRFARHRRGWTLARTEAESGGRWTLGRLQSWESGHRHPSVVQLDELLRFYDSGITVTIEVEQ